MNLQLLPKHTQTWTNLLQETTNFVQLDWEWACKWDRFKNKLQDHALTDVEQLLTTPLMDSPVSPFLFPSAFLLLVRLILLFLTIPCFGVSPSILATLLCQCMDSWKGPYQTSWVHCGADEEVQTLVTGPERVARETLRC